MGKQFENVVVSAVKNQEEAVELMGKLYDVARPGAVFGEPITAEGRTVVTASEVSVGMGFGFGIGAGTTPESEGDPGQPEGEEAEFPAGGSGVGGGGGGGGAAAGRPVAVITIDQEGVKVEPVLDITKVALAFFTMLGSIFVMGAKIRKASR
jgi:uncharacterized spore protein YtfJ